MTEWNGRLWLLLPRYDGTDVMFMIAFSVSPDELSAALSRLTGDQTRDLVLTRPDGTVLAACGNGEELIRDRAPERNLLTAETSPVFSSLRLTGYTVIDEAMAPFVTYRIVLWVLSALALLFGRSTSWSAPCASSNRIPGTGLTPPAFQTMTMTSMSSSTI